MPFSVGSTVVVLTLGKKTGIVVEAGRSGRYRVQIENTVVSCREAELVALPEERKKKGRRGLDLPVARTPRVREARLPPHAGVRGEAPGKGSPHRVDLHGLTVEEAMTRVLREIDRALIGGADRIEVVHGKGSGRIRDALHRELAAISVVASFRLDPHNPGVTWVYF